SRVVNPPHVPPPPPAVFVYDASQDAALTAAWEAHRRQALRAAVMETTGAVVVTAESFPDPALRQENKPLHTTADSFFDRLLEICKLPKPAEYRSITV